MRVCVHACMCSDATDLFLVPINYVMAFPVSSNRPSGGGHWREEGDVNKLWTGDDRDKVMSRSRD